ncbi:heparinase II/III family protein [Hymenobacter sp. ASUV-10]|uniref:Heparinase II/III family protein n=1 Tax=Hymenobacter aranciens TaxID=3063996 RepID=A0ABT9B772_9BACT|nr:heparinase II/III family protein [Hymenobacter sp. ASUV-10]MDO7874125.1 heparinase II/III family protein [Hymenobacter sp. ASUV-10]
MLAGRAAGQEGSWQPAGAAVGYPRTLLTAAELPAVRAALAAPVAANLYAGLYAETAAAPPTDNSSTSGRRARATFAKNAAFVALLNRRPAAGGAPETLPPAERDSLRARVTRLLATLNPQVEPFITPPATSSYDQWQWRSKELMDYLTAYDLLRGAGAPAEALAAGQARLQAFAGNLQRAATAPYLNISSFTFFGQIKNNHALMTAAALGLAAVVLNETGSADAAQQPQAWLNTGLYHLDNVLWEDARRQSDPAAVAGYAEGPYYFKYAFLNCLPFFRALGNFLPDTTLSCTVGATTRRIRHPFHDPRYDRLYEWITTIMMPDGRFPALEDSYIDMGMPELALTGKSQYLRPLALSKLETSQLNTLTRQLRDLTVDMRAAYLAANLPPGPPASPALLTALPASGNLVFRSGADSLATYLHLYGKSGAAQANAGGHSQADASSFVLHAYGQLLALDPGYLSYASRGTVGQAPNHNLVLVDGAGPAIGTAGSANDAPATVQALAHTPGLAYGEVQTTYQGTQLSRRALAVRGQYFVLHDVLTAPTAHAYTWQLHGYGTADAPTAATGHFTPRFEQEEGLWQKNGVSLLAHVATPADSLGRTTFAAAARPHELTYNTPENHTALLVERQGEAQTQFLAALYPFVGAAPHIRSHRLAGAAGLAVRSATHHDMLLAQSANTLLTVSDSLLTAPLRTDGRLLLYSITTAGEFAQLFMEQGTVLRHGEHPVARAAERVTLGWERRTATQYAGYVSGATTLTLALPQTPESVAGPAVSSFAYDAATHQLALVLTAATSFTITTLPAGALPVTLTQLTARRQPGRVLLSWQTASESQNRGFEIQRATGPAQEFGRLGFVAGAGTVARPSAYTFADAQPPAATAYYRLRQLDANGAASYSPVVAVGPTPAAAPLLRAWPIPASKVLHVEYAGAATVGQLCLLNSLGQVVRQQPLVAQGQLELSGLAPGVYQLRARGGASQPAAVRVVVAP